MTPTAPPLPAREARPMSRYTYLGAKGTDLKWIGQPCDPVLRADGKVLVGRSPRNQLVRFEDGTEVVVSARRLRLNDRPSTAPLPPATVAGRRMGH